MNVPEYLSSVEECVERAISAVGPNLVVGVPLGLGKPNQLINAFYRRARSDSGIHLTILTALSLEIPRPASDVEAKLLAPFLARHFGDYVELDYMQAIRDGTLPENVRVHEFYFRAGSMNGVESAQRNYISTNYTFVARDLFDRGVNVLMQLVAEKEIDGRNVLSLSGNTDVSLDLIQLLTEAERPFFTVAQVHSQLPFMYNRAIVEPASFDCVVRNRHYDTTLFATPNMAVSAVDYAIGFRASTLIRDGGTLQIGIGALGDAIVYGCQIRQRDNQSYRDIAAGLAVEEDLVAKIGGLDRFNAGLYGCSEMLVNGFLHLRSSGVLKREVFDDPSLQRLINEGRLSLEVKPNTLRILIDEEVVGRSLSPQDVAYLRYWGVFNSAVELRDARLWLAGQSVGSDLGDERNFEECCRHFLGSRLKHGVYLHGGFFLGPPDFYDVLRTLPREEAEGIAMDSVRRINRIDDPDLHPLQRRFARFINTGMMVTLSGAVVSDGLENGQVISGVGGQYNFVAQAHDLPDARSIICLRAVRGRGREVASNIVWNYGHTTIPRHLRDIVVTEYGVADLRARSDEEVIQGLINIADSRFQNELLSKAKEAGKISRDYVVPEPYRKNLPERIANEIEGWKRKGFFPFFPLGTEFSDQEIALAQSLREIKALMEEPRSLIRALIRSFVHGVDEEQAAPYLERIGLDHPDTPRDLILQHLLLLELEEHGHLRSS